MRRVFLLLAILSILLTACASKEEQASKIVSDFVAFVSSNDSVSVIKVYPSSENFYSKLPKLNDIEIISSTVKDSIAYVEAVSKYYDDNSKFIQKNMKFYISLNSHTPTIVDSEGLIEYPDEINRFAIKIGAINRNSRDVLKGTLYPHIASALYIEFLRHQWRINSGIERVSWSWEADYGTPNGRCTIKNTLPFTVKNVKYKITYFRGNDIIGSDDGTAAYEIGSGDLKSFTFYSSGVNGYRAQTARIEFEVPEKYVYEWTLNDNYDISEFDEIQKVKSQIKSL